MGGSRTNENYYWQKTVFVIMVTAYNVPIKVYKGGLVCGTANFSSLVQHGNTCDTGVDMSLMTPEHICIGI